MNKYCSIKLLPGLFGGIIRSRKICLGHSITLGQEIGSPPWGPVEWELHFHVYEHHPRSHYHGYEEPESLQLVKQNLSHPLYASN